MKDQVEAKMVELFRQYRKDPSLTRTGSELADKVISIMDEVFGEDSPPEEVEYADYEEVDEEAMDESFTDEGIDSEAWMPLVQRPASMEDEE